MMADGVERPGGTAADEVTADEAAAAAAVEATAAGVAPGRGVLIATTRGEIKLQAAREGDGFSVEKRMAFLDGLAATCNIAAAAAHAGVSSSTVYRARARDAAFAGHWRTALEIGYDRLEARVLEHGGAGGAIDIDPVRAEHAIGDGAGGPGDGSVAAGAAFDFDRAMTVLRYARAARQGEPNRRTGRPPRMPTREEINDALLKALAAERDRAEAKGRR